MKTAPMYRGGKQGVIWGGAGEYEDIFLASNPSKLWFIFQIRLVLGLERLITGESFSFELEVIGSINFDAEKNDWIWS